MEKEKISLMKLINKMNKKCSEVSKHTLLSPNEKRLQPYAGRFFTALR